MFKILIVDDEKAILRSLTFALEQYYEIFTTTDSEKSLVLMRENNISLVLLDLRLGKIDGIDLMKKMLEQDREATIIIMTAHSSIENSVTAIQAGAFYFITKPIQTAHLTLLLEKAVEQGLMRNKINKLENVIRNDIIGNSPQMQSILKLIDKVKDTSVGVLITGESGTGKELIAKKIHFSSNRKNKPFIAINCAAMPESLLESELFGYKKGSFTGAIKDEIGVIRKANGGTIFLDEIAEMDLRLQTKLLRFLQEKEVHQIGGDIIKVDVRVICATNRDLESEIISKQFRSDLYYRINVIHIVAPPLRERIKDLEYLVPYFVQKYSTAYGKSMVTIHKSAFDLLNRYNFPGNVRECENIIQRAVLLCAGEQICEDDLNIKNQSENGVFANENYIPIYSHETMKQIERKIIKFVLKENDNNRRKTAESLAISERTLQYKIKEYLL